MSNHFHLVIYSDPLTPNDWSASEVVDRWLSVCPPRDYRGRIDDKRTQDVRLQLLNQPDKVVELRRKLGSVSVFMKLLKQPIARRANLEDRCGGHFFEQRFYSGALLDEAAVIAAMAYVDLNPVRAGIAERLEACRDTSIEQRLRHSTETVEAYLAPLMSGLAQRNRVGISTSAYVDLLTSQLPRRSQDVPDRVVLWRKRLRVIGHRQRAFGALDILTQWLAARQLAMRETPLA